MTTEDYPFELFFDLVPDLLCIAGFDGYFKRINPAVSKVLEYSQEELYSRPINDFIHPEDVSMTNQRRSQLFESQPLLNFENRYITKSGKIIWLYWTAWPNTEKKLVFAIAKEITEKKRLEERKDELLSDLSHKNEELKSLTYITAHDLRSPVSSILSVFQLLNLEKIKDEESVELIKLIQRSTLGLKENLNKYLNKLSEKDSNNDKKELVNLSEILQETLITLNPTLKSVNAQIKHDFSQAGEVYFNRLHLESIFLNLLGNSIKYRKTDVAPQVCIWTEFVAERVFLYIKDNGKGMNMEKVKDKIFKMNQTFHGHSEAKGIGLYLVNSHLQNAGGSIEVESEEGVGTTFKVIF